MASRLTQIALEIAGLLQGISRARGFAFDFGTVNQPDLALCTFPAADITYTEETPRSDTQAAYGWDEATFRIKITAFNPNVNPFCPTLPVPVHAIDSLYDDIIAALKKVFRCQQGYFPLSGSSYTIYKGFQKNIEKSGDSNMPDSVSFTLKVHYQSTDTATGSPVPLQKAF